MSVEKKFEHLSEKNLMAPLIAKCTWRTHLLRFVSLYDLIKSINILQRIAKRLVAEVSQTGHHGLVPHSGQLGQYTSQLGQQASEHRIQLGRLTEEIGQLNRQQSDRLGHLGQRNDQLGQCNGKLGQLAQQESRLKKRETESCAPACPPSRSPFFLDGNHNNWNRTNLMAAGEGE